jgi:hypothetical protein
MVNPYGEGFASETIVRVLTTVPLSQELLLKRHPGISMQAAVPGRSQR